MSPGEAVWAKQGRKKMPPSFTSPPRARDNCEVAPACRGAYQPPSTALSLPVPCSSCPHRPRDIRVPRALHCGTHLWVCLFQTFLWLQTILSSIRTYAFGPLHLRSSLVASFSRNQFHLSLTGAQRECVYRNLQWLSRNGRCRLSGPSSRVSIWDLGVFLMPKIV